MFQANPFLRAALVLFLFSLCIAVPVTGAPQKQSAKTITILMLDGKTGKPVIPNNYMVRVDHLDALQNEALKINDDGSGKVTVPAGATFLSVQGTYHQSLDIYINCDAGLEKNTSTLHWYSIADIMNSGVAAPDECYKGKYTDNFGITPKPGEFIFFVREISWRDRNAE